MKPTYKICFWLCLTLLIVSNGFWVYNTVDLIVTDGYSDVSCKTYYRDMIQFKTLMETKSQRLEAISFLEANNIAFEKIEKGTDVFLIFNAFELQYAENGNLISAREF